MYAVEEITNQSEHHLISVASLNEDHINAAKIEAQKQDISLIESIVKLGFATETELLGGISEKVGLEFVNLQAIDIDENAVNALTAKIASHYHAMPTRLDGNDLYIAVAEPMDDQFTSELELILHNQFSIRFLLATTDSISKAIRKHYGLGAATVEQMVLQEKSETDDDQPQSLTDENKAHDASVLKLVNQILADAINGLATDVHIEPYENYFRVRYRIDGVLYDAGIPASAKHFKDGITSRIKIMSGLDIAEKRLPQDGRTQISILNNLYDLRISILPTRFGEAINIRILPRDAVISDFSSLGMEAGTIKKLNTIISKPHGIILVTGPTGSGKTTTLYTCINQLNGTKRKILTIEDPIEYDMPGITQMQVHPEIGFSFSKALRSMLRHDPDVMLVGEIRDLETAETAIRTSLTGHLVFSTLHTNSAASAIARLLDMGIEPYLVASSVEAILAQRLVRVICPDCREACTIDAETATAIKNFVPANSIRAYRGRGCSKCRFTGYRGRTVITELLIMSEQIRQMTISRNYSSDIEASARKEMMTTLFEAGLEKASAGITTYDEILRVTKAAVL